MTVTVDTSLSSCGLNFSDGYYDTNTLQFIKGVNSNNRNSTNYKFEDCQLSADHPDVIQLDVLLERAFVEDDDRQYAMNCAASILLQKSVLNPILIIFGPANSGKSVWLNLISETLGSYAYNVDQIVSDDFSRYQNRKLICFQESLDLNETIGSFMCIKSAVQHPLRTVIVCQQFPLNTSKNSMFHDKIAVLPFKSIFVHDEQCQQSEEQRKAEKTFARNMQIDLSKLKYAFMWKIMQQLQSSQK